MQSLPDRRIDGRHLPVPLPAFGLLGNGSDYFVFWGDASNEILADASNAAVRSTDHFNWTFIALFAVIVYIYFTELKNKNYKGVVAALSLYGVHWLYGDRERRDRRGGRLCALDRLAGKHLLHPARRRLLGTLLDVLDRRPRDVEALARRSEEEDPPDEQPRPLRDRERRLLRHLRDLPRRHAGVPLDLFLVGCDPRVRHDLHPVLPRRVPRPGPCAEETETVPRGRLGTRPGPASGPDSARRHLIPP
ncbi:MAG: hypothetical protein M0C28_18495 [Candidatus Moduliflexus flocculans]|nr:hypothetical protein [Candidatus Moduliflexus flocculans]